LSFAGGSFTHAPTMANDMSRAIKSKTESQSSWSENVPTIRKSVLLSF
jgi:hypothetical protein